MECPNTDPSGQVRAERRERRLDPLAQLLGGPAVECDGADRLGLDATIHQPRDPRDERGGLPGTRGRHAQDGAGRRRGGGSLVALEARQPLDNRGVMRHVGDCGEPRLRAVHRGAAIQITLPRCTTAPPTPSSELTGRWPAAIVRTRRFEAWWPSSGLISWRWQLAQLTQIQVRSKVTLTDRAHGGVPVRRHVVSCPNHVEETLCNPPLAAAFAAS